MFGAVFAIGSKVLSTQIGTFQVRLTPTGMQNATASSVVGDGTVVY